MLAREETMKSEHLKGDLDKVIPVVNTEGSDSILSGRFGTGSGGSGGIQKLHDLRRFYRQHSRLFPFQPGR